eukprot:gene13542-17286_t
MARICAITGKRPVKGSRINRKGQSKKSGGIGTHVTSITKRKFRPNLQRIRVKLPNGGTKRMLVSVKAIKRVSVRNLTAAQTAAVFLRPVRRAYPGRPPNEAGALRYSARKTMAAFCPPKPRLLLNTVRTDAARATLG